MHTMLKDTIEKHYINFHRKKPLLFETILQTKSHVSHMSLKHVRNIYAKYVQNSVGLTPVTKCECVFCTCGKNLRSSNSRFTQLVASLEKFSVSRMTISLSDIGISCHRLPQVATICCVNPVLYRVSTRIPFENKTCGYFVTNSFIIWLIICTACQKHTF